MPFPWRCLRYESAGKTFPSSCISPGEISAADNQHECVTRFTIERALPKDRKLPHRNAWKTHARARPNRSLRYPPKDS